MEFIDVLIGIIQYRMEMAAQVCEHTVHRIQLPGQGASHLPGGIGGSIRRLRLYEVNDGLRLGEIHLPIEKGPLGELPPAGRPGPRLIQRLQPGSQHRRGTVAMKLHRVLPGVAVGAAGEDGHALVQYPALPVL